MASNMCIFSNAQRGLSISVHDGKYNELDIIDVFERRRCCEKGINERMTLLA